MSALARLRSFVAADPAASSERCQLCAAALPQRHSHLAEPAAQRVACACAACATLLGSVGGGRFRRIPRLVVRLEGLHIDDSTWSRLDVPVGLAFFVRDGASRRTVAAYPSPAGVVRSLLPLADWQAVERLDPMLASLQDDVEALLVDRGRSGAWRVPIDACYELAGRMRGAHGARAAARVGGQAGREAVEEFFAELALRARPGASGVP